MMMFFLFSGVSVPSARLGLVGPGLVGSSTLVSSVGALAR
jgi:hypothetical protein